MLAAGLTRIVSKLLGRRQYEQQECACVWKQARTKVFRRKEVTRALLRSSPGQQTTSRPMPGAPRAYAFLLLKTL